MQTPSIETLAQRRRDGTVKVGRTVEAIMRDITSRFFMTNSTEVKHDLSLLGVRLPDSTLRIHMVKAANNLGLHHWGGGVYKTFAKLQEAA